VTIIVNARQPVSRRLKSRSMSMPIVQATTTLRGTWNSWINIRCSLL